MRRRLRVPDTAKGRRPCESSAGGKSRPWRAVGRGVLPPSLRGVLGDRDPPSRRRLAAACMVAVAVWAPKAYILVDDSTITFGPALTSFAARRNTFNRREVARIRATNSPITRNTLFLRSDGSTLCSTPGFFWGRDGLQSLADYLGVPPEW